MNKQNIVLIFAVKPQINYFLYDAVLSMYNY